MKPTVVVLGGYGNFGAIISRRLAALDMLDLVIAGRNEGRAREFGESIGARAAQLDHSVAGFADRLQAFDAQLLVHCAGPFQGCDYRVARAAIQAGVNYVDIADGRRFVCDIVTLDRAARDAGVAVISGASSVPALSGAIVDEHLHEFAQLERIEFGIATSSRVPGVATVAGAMSYCGVPFDLLIDGRHETAWGWQGLHRRRFPPPLGRRWMSLAEVPDLELFPERYPTLQTVTFAAGLGLSVTHLGTWLLAGLRRVTGRPDAARLAPVLQRAGRALERFGDGNSAMFMALDGRGHDGGEHSVLRHVIARDNHGIQIPCIAAVVLARRFAETGLEVGARPCLGIVTLDEYLTGMADLNVSYG